MMSCGYKIRCQMRGAELGQAVLFLLLCVMLHIRICVGALHSA